MLQLIASLLGFSVPHQYRPIALGGLCVCSLKHYVLAELCGWIVLEQTLLGHVYHKSVKGALIQAIPYQLALRHIMLFFPNHLHSHNQQKLPSLRQLFPGTSSALKACLRLSETLCRAVSVSVVHGRAFDIR